MGRLVFREVASLLVVLTIMLVIQGAFNAQAPVWALVTFVAGWVGVRSADLAKQRRRQSRS